MEQNKNRLPSNASLADLIEGENYMQSSPVERGHYETIQKLHDYENIEAITDFNKDQIRLVQQFVVINGASFLKKFCDKKTQNKYIKETKELWKPNLSLNRQSRREAVQIATGSQNQNPGGILDMIRSGLNRFRSRNETM